MENLESWKLHPKAMDAQKLLILIPGTEEAHPGDMKAHPGDMKAHPGKNEGLPWSRGGIGSPRNKQKYISVRTETNRNKICCGFVSVCFVKPKTKNVGLFRFVSVFRTYNETTETNRTVS
jgi:hypothetical protein